MLQFVQLSNMRLFAAILLSRAWLSSLVVLLSMVVNSVVVVLVTKLSIPVNFRFVSPFPANA